MLQVVIHEDNTFDAASFVSAVDFEGFAAEVDAFMSPNDDPNVPRLNGYQPATGPSDQ